MFTVLQLLCMIRTPDRYKTKIADLQGMIEKDLMEMEQVLVSLSQWNKIELIDAEQVLVELCNMERLKFNL